MPYWTDESSYDICVTVGHCPLCRLRENIILLDQLFYLKKRGVHVCSECMLTQ